MDKDILAGDPFAFRGEADRRDRRDRRLMRLTLEHLQERLNHELMGDTERQEVRDRILHLSRRLGISK